LITDHGLELNIKPYALALVRALSTQSDKIK